MLKERVNVTRPALPPLQEYIDEIKDMWETGIMTHQGPKHIKLESELAKYLDAESITLFGNGHLAMELGMRAMHMEGEVITTPFTFGSTVQAILRNGLKPVFCDIKKDDFTIDSEKIESLITDKTCAILPVHVYGNVCDVKRIQEIGKKHGLRVIYDGAHAFGETYDGMDVSKFGDATMFSFHATKVFNTVEGGCLVYRDEGMTEELQGLRQFGQIVGSERTPYIGTNAKLTEMHAAMGICNLRHIDEYIEKRENVVKTYRRRLEHMTGIQLSVVQPNVKSNYAYFPIVVNEAETGFTREELLDCLKNHGIYARKYFYPLTCDFEVVKEMGIVADVPMARYISDRVISLPCYPDLELNTVERICYVIEGMY